MGYVRTAGMSTAARRRRRRTALVLSGLVLLLAVVFGYAVAYYQGWLPGPAGGADAEQDATTATAPSLQPADVVVNVYNATGEPGLAGRTAESLEQRGFSIAAVDNDPERATVEHTADIRHGAEGAEAARLLQEAVPGAELVPDERESGEVDLVLGAEFDGLPDIAESTATPTGED